jgi:hypothetical protein
MQTITEDERQFLMRLLLQAFMDQPASTEKVISILRKVGGVDKRIIVEECPRCGILIRPEGGHRCGSCGRDI